MKNYIAYYRVSTKQQGNSGLGLEGQKETVLRFADNCEACILQEFTEIETGKKNDREELQKAIAAAKANNALLLIAKLDRLARNAGFIFTLRDAGVNFVCCDMPDANTLTIGIFATLAQYEAELISTRTKAALAAKKARGFKLGTPKPFDQAAREKSIAVRKAKAVVSRENLEDTAEIIKEAIQLADFRKKSITIAEIVKKLNTYNLSTTTGKRWSTDNARPLISEVLEQMNLQTLPKYQAPTIKGERKAHKPANKIAVAGKIATHRAAGQSFRAIANDLNNLGFKTSQDKFFTSMQVQRIFNEYQQNA